MNTEGKGTGRDNYDYRNRRTELRGQGWYLDNTQETRNKRGTGGKVDYWLWVT